jgi:hypothetical protein
MVTTQRASRFSGRLGRVAVSHTADSAAPRVIAGEHDVVFNPITIHGAPSIVEDLSEMFNRRFGAA